MSQSVERFSSRVANYVLFRPGYPREIVSLLTTECGLTKQSIIADIGSGTGKLSDLFLRNGNRLIGVEPNDGMRQAAEQILREFHRFESINATAEATTLADASVDFVIAGQAFHWFDPVKSKTEFHRILKPNGWIVLVWNKRLIDTTPFLRDYETLLLKFGTDYESVRHENAETLLEEFFAPTVPRLKSFENEQLFDFEGLKGRVLSSSYTPEPNHPQFEPMMQELKSIFDEHAIRGQVSFDYETKVFFGRVGG